MPLPLRILLLTPILLVATASPGTVCLGAEATSHETSSKLPTKDTSPKKPAVNVTGAVTSYPWQFGRQYRYLWVLRGERVGETRFRVGRIPYPGRPGELLYEIGALRSYDHNGTIQRASGATHVAFDGTPVRFEETMTIVNAAQPIPTEQETKFERVAGKARVVYTSGRSKPIVRDRRLEAGTFLCGNQAIEHWMVFVSMLPSKFDTHTVKLYYPDHLKVYSVELNNRGTETIKIGKRNVNTTRYGFDCSDYAMSGNIWVTQRRMVQVQFHETKVRVVLTDLDGVKAKKR